MNLDDDSVNDSFNQTCSATSPKKCVGRASLRIFVLAAFSILLCFQTTLGQTENQVRTWSSQKGSFSVEAKFTSFSNGIVELTTQDGKSQRVPVEKLSGKDQLYICEIAKWGRAWSTSKGDISYIAKFQSQVGNKKVRLLSITGETIIVNLSTLDSESRKYATALIAERNTPPTPGASSAIDVPNDVALSDELIRKRISEFTKVAAKLKIDGKGKDWQELPHYSSDVRFTDGSLDIEQVSIAPREKDLVVMIRTRERPSPRTFSFYVRIDFHGRRAHSDIQIGLATKAEHRIKIYDESQDSKTIIDVKNNGIKVKVGDVVEARIPYSVLSSILPDNMSKYLVGEHARPYLRVETISYDNKARRIADYGPAVASYRFLTDEYPLDPKEPGENRDTLPITVPVNGKWLVGHGAMGYTSHANIYAYDLYIVDHQKSPSSVQNSKDNSEYYTWEKPIFSPLEGRIIQVENENPDSRARDKGKRHANKVLLGVKGSEDLHLHMLHFRKGSVEVEVGQQVQPGDVVALAGNSGFSAYSHLHLELIKGGTKPRTIPLSFEKAIVSLNPDIHDPWTRYVEDWEIRPGVFVEKPFEH